MSDPSKRRASLALAAGSAACVALMAIPTDAAGYVRTQHVNGGVPLRWPEPRIELDLAVAGVPDDLERTVVLAAVRRAAAAWSSPACTALRIDVRETGDRVTGGQRDRRNTIVFHRRSFCRGGVVRDGACYDRRIAAMTSVHVGESRPATAEAAIDEVDIELNAADFQWSIDAARTLAGGLAMDLQTVLTHEIGHALGLAHTCYHGNPKAHRKDARGKVIPRCSHAASPTSASVMVPAGDRLLQLPLPVKHELSADDRQAVCALYPTLP